MNNNQKFNDLLNACTYPRQIYAALLALAGVWTPLTGAARQSGGEAAKERPPPREKLRNSHCI